MFKISEYVSTLETEINSNISLSFFHISATTPAILRLSAVCKFL